MKLLYRALFLSDIHFPTANKIMVVGKDAKVFKLLKTGKYKKVIQIGDLVCFDDFTSHERSPDHEADTLETLEMVHDFNDNLRAAIGPDGEIIYVEGNHEIRVERYLVRNAPYLLPFDELKIPALFKLAKNEIRWKPYRERLILDGLKITHGSFVRGESGHSARAELKAHRWRTPGISGHTHRQGWIKDADTAWMELGHLADPDYAISAKYLADKDPNWNAGFGEGSCCVDDDGKFHWFITPIEIKNNSFVVDGVVY